MQRILAVALLAWTPFGWQPLRGDAPSVGKSVTQNPKQKTELATTQPRVGTEASPLIVETHARTKSEEETAKAKADEEHTAGVERWTLILTGAAALFTGLLVIVGYCGVRAANRTLRAIQEQVGVMQTELVLARRPRIGVRTFYFSDPKGAGGVFGVPSGVAHGSTCFGQFYIRNHGGTDAKIDEIWSGTLIARPLPMIRPYEGEDGEKSAIILKPGQSVTWPFAHKRPLDEFGAQCINDDKSDFYVLGRIDYTDKLGIPRKTGFCRHFDPRTQRFVPVKDRDYEYND